MTCRLIAVHMKQCIIFIPRRHHLSQRVVLLVKGIWPQPMPTLALRNPKTKRMVMMCPSHLCPRCWPAAHSPTSPMPAPPSGGCLWKVNPQQTLLRVPKFLRGLLNHSLGESTLNEKLVAVSRAVPLPPPPPPHRSYPVRSRAS